MAARCCRLDPESSRGVRKGPGLSYQFFEIRASAIENVRSACPIAGIITSLEQRRAGRGGAVAGVLDGAGGAHYVVGGDAAALVGQLISAARFPLTFQDPDPHQGLENWLEMSRRERMPFGQDLGRDRAATAMERNIDDGSNREEALAGEQRHSGHRRPL
jgi:hypothetical protein